MWQPLESTELIGADAMIVGGEAEVTVPQELTLDSEDQSWSDVCLGDAVLTLTGAPSFIEISGDKMKFKPLTIGDAGLWTFKVQQQARVNGASTFTTQITEFKVEVEC